MKKEDYLRRRGGGGEAAYEKMLQQSRDWMAKHPEEKKANDKEWCENNPDKVVAHNRERCRKGGRHYENNLKREHRGLRGERNRVRRKHARFYQPYKQIIAPTSQLHHEWIPGTADYRGAALVEPIQHQYGIINPIVILEGEITLLIEAEIRGI